MRRFATTLALALCLVGCTSEVKLLTASGPLEVSAGNHGLASGVLLPDGEFGTVLRVEKKGFTYPFHNADGDLSYVHTAPYLDHSVEDGLIIPVTWGEGYTGRRGLSGEVEVLNAHGEVVARTGLRYFCEQTTAPGRAWVGCVAIGDSP